MIKAIVFDVDDTLYNQQPSFIDAFNTAFDFDIEDDIKKNIYQFYQNQMHDAMSNNDNHQLSISDLSYGALQTTFQEFELNGLTEESAAKFDQLFAEKRENIQLAEGLTTIFNELVSKFKLGIITNGKTKEQLSKIMKLKLHHWIDREQIITSEEAKADKPDPLIFTLMNRKFDLRGNEMLYVGSSYHQDIIPAKKAGWQAVWYNPFNGNITDPNYIPDQTVANIDELQELLIDLAAQVN
ncbi:HAD family hydrolase [Lentilactobacillus sp. Marseille-Q4993]|uniref:HAD family hydrolase n=1 Tax=Lentilactobacillus sp. Marseille-Q4993 TaxID=3039492 RepID=UPI0024BCAEB2|nr:HAD family hydrolase [Lentilactobacillus sp. Marseille-Q4993]